MFATLALAFALGAPAIKEKELPKGPGYLGIRFMKEEEDGLTITDVNENTPAKKAGLQAGDVMLKLNEKSLQDVETTDMVEMVGKMKAGSEITLAIRRGAEKLNVRVKLGPRPADFDTLQKRLPPIALPPQE